MPYEPLHHKYRPQTFADLVGQEAIATTLTNAILTERIAPAYLFTGPRGTGKTSSARILAKSLNCLKSNKPTKQPCGICEVCQGIANGSALDVTEIDAASNTGVDNIRELIERAQFAPVQCRYKVYVIDECLTGDSLVQTSEGLIRIDDPNIKGKKVLSYNDSSRAWEFKKVVRWLDQGERQTLVIRTTNCEIRCTGDHLVRTEQGWIAAKDVKEGAKILSPVNVDAAHSSTNLGRWTTDRSPSAQKEVHRFKFIQKGTPRKKIKSSPVGLQQSGIQQQSSTKGLPQLGTTTQAWAQILAGNGWQTFNSIQSPRWATSLERVESVKVAGVQRVYDIEVVENHNFVANGLLVHNCHMLSGAAFNALLKTLEEPPDRVVFVLATTDPQRVLPTIISRCQRFDFRRIALEAMVTHLQSIASQENINITHAAVQLVAQVSQGGLRDAESLLDQLSLLSSQVTVERVWDLVGSCSEPDLMELLRAIAENNPEAVLDCVRRLMDRGREPLTILQNLAGFYRDLLIAKTAPSRKDLVAVTPSIWKALCEDAVRWNTASILSGQQHLAKSEVQIKNTTQPSLWMEVTLLGLLSISNSGQPVEHSHISIAAQQPRQLSQRREPAQDTGSTIQPSTSVPSNAAKDVKETQSKSPLPEQVAWTQALPVPEESLEPSNNSVSVPDPPADVALPSVSQRETTWQRVLVNLQPISTRELLRQLCHLIEFDGVTARIGITSQAWYKKAQTQSSFLPNITAAFQETFKREVQVDLELATPAQTKTKHPVNELPSPGTSTAPTASPQITAQPLTSQMTTTSFSQAQSFNQSGVVAKEDNLKDLEPPPSTPDGEEEDAIAAQSLANSFKGEVMKLDLDSALLVFENRKPLPLATSSTEWEEPDLSGRDDDIDF